MSNPVSFRSPAEIDAAYRYVVGAHSRDASLQGPPEHHASVALGCATATDGAVAAYELAEVAHVLPHAVEVALGPFMPVLGPTAAGIAGLLEINHAWEEHERRGTEVDHHQMRGAVLYVLGRIPNPDRPEVVERFGTHERDGARDAARFERLRPQAFAELQARTRTSFLAGETAALVGDRRGAALEAALRDPIFRMGYEEAMALRAHDPASFEARAAEARALASTIEQARASVPITG
ncbi:MAG: hypothetical protein OHK0013_42560 [Sandaracinaceae bacterium]